jgi:hypothetical protein
MAFRKSGGSLWIVPPVIVLLAISCALGLSRLLTDSVIVVGFFIF